MSNDPANSIDRASAAQLRHALRTPLNHVIGYSEMLIEDLQDTGQAAGAGAEHLRKLIFNAKELVKFIQNGLPAEKSEIRKAEIRDLQFWLKGHVRQLSDDVEALSSTASQGQAADIAKIRFAIEHLAAFAEGRPGVSIDDSLILPLRSCPGQGEQEGRLLVVDDSAANRDILSRHLLRNGYAVEMAENGRSALELLQSYSFDLVLLDVLMPEMDGFEVLTRIKADARLRNTPVIMISALDESSNVIRCIQMGAEDYLTKPFDPVLLSARLSASLEKKRLRDQEKKRTEELESALQELRKTQDQLLVQEKLASLGALTAGIAHEIKNPLNFVNNFAALSHELLEELRELLNAHPRDDGAILELLSDVDRNVLKVEEHGKRADRIVRGMLLHSRGNSTEPEMTDINALLAECVNLAYHGLRAQDPDFNVQITTELDPALAALCVFPQDLSRVFLNLVNNACYAAYERQRRLGSGFSPRVAVRTCQKDGPVAIRIRDNGDGIPAEIRDKIFVPFFTTKPAGAGTGLGLSISYDIVVGRHGGEMLVESEPGEFTEFSVILPKEPKGAPCPKS